MAEDLKVGGELEAWCTSCRQMKWHVIVALVAGRPAKVECHGCHKQHQYRATPPGTPAEGSARSPRARASRPAAAAAPTDDLDAMIAGRGGEARAYSPNERFEVNDVVRHPSFDVGVVTATPAPQKVEIAFRDGRKILLHDRGAAVPSKLAPPPRRDEEGKPFSGTSDSPRGLK